MWLQSDVSDKTSLLIEILLNVIDQACDKEKPQAAIPESLFISFLLKDSLIVHDLKSYLSF